MIRILKEKPWIWRIPFLFLLMAGTVWAIRRHGKETSRAVQTEAMQWYRQEGSVFGTLYHVTYEAETDLQPALVAALDSVDGSLSMFNEHSTLRRINDNVDMQTDSMFCTLFRLATQVSEATGGAFDVTVAPLVNAWGFGYKNGKLPDEAQTDSLRQLVDYRRVSLCEGKVVKEDPRMVMDFSAIAKGFGCDVVAEVFRTRGSKNFMVEIGGEIVVQGHNDKGQPWRVGVNKPVEDDKNPNHELQEILHLTDGAMATSGNYRNFYTTGDGRRIAHTIDPHTGRPVQHSLLSATVLAPTCAEADAFATSFMVMGLDKAREVLQRQRQLRAYLIYAEGEEFRVFTNLESVEPAS